VADRRQGTDQPSLFQSREEAHEVMHKLTEYLGERVCTASEHCRALMDWVETIQASGYDPRVGEAWSMIYLPLMKSNLAARLVYGGEKVRTEPCPKHKGRWSGCQWGSGACTEGCMSGSNVTGWLAEPHEFVQRPGLSDGERSFYEREGIDPMELCWKCNAPRHKPLHKVEAEA
jgi:hypothetical protein